jgi:murein L,D-transpeptidase YcbB/YkuD
MRAAAVRTCTRSRPCLLSLLLAMLIAFAPAASMAVQAPMAPVTAAAAWLDADGRPSAAALGALAVLGGAGDDGLVPGDYGATALAKEAARLASAAVPTAASQAFARDLDEAIERFLHDLHVGRVDPRTLGFRVGRRSPQVLDLAAQARSAALAGRLPGLVADLRPAWPQYARLRTALARYRALAAPEEASPLRGFRSVASTAGGLDAAALRRRLVAFGDLSPAGATAADAGPDLVAAVERFQRRHGLVADGVVGPATARALEVPVAARVRQLELALERLRWLPDFGGQPFIGINIAMFRLWAWDPGRPAEAPLDMAVVVGRALDTRTPVLSESLRYVVFRPWWNVPASIVRKEILPAMARDPAYLRRQDMEIVRGAGDDAQPVAQTPENLALLGEGALRVRQRPGPRNSLGLVKFVFPNDADVYLHGTPARQLFGRARRDFSHGCVRVEDPPALARWVLRGRPAWTVERIEAAMAADAPQRVDLPKPLPVILFYVTAMVMPANGALHFAADIYGHDARLEQALAARSPR